MSDRPRPTWRSFVGRPRGGLRRPGWPALLPLLLLLGLVVAVAVDRSAEIGLADLANQDRARVSQWNAALRNLPDRPLVLVGMDPDLGTYPEIRAVTRATLDELVAAGARLAFVSFTPEGRAVAAAELDRLEGALLLNAGFIAGAEAGLVLAVSDLVPDGAAGAVADAIRERGGGMAAFDAVLIVGGMDFGPRPWVEQVRTRLPDLRMLAVAPTFAHPELVPYLRTGQLDALMATVRDGAAYVAQVTADADAGEAPRDQPPQALAMLGGMLVALGVVLRAVLATRRPASRQGNGAENEAEA
jgi:hypothetical protein